MFHVKHFCNAAGRGRALRVDIALLLRPPLVRAEEPQRLRCAAATYNSRLKMVNK
jgi:hypothetical protein